MKRLGFCLLLMLGGRLTESNETFDDENNDRKWAEKWKLDLWSRGAFDLDTKVDNLIVTLPMRMGPVSYVRRQILQHRDSETCEMNGFCSPIIKDIRGGGTTSIEHQGQLIARKIQELGSRYGSEFLEAIEKNVKDHADDCKKSCEIYYCASPDGPLKSLDELLGESSTTIKSYSMGPVPPEDFAESFGFPLDIIKVTENAPLFSSEEAAQVVANAEEEGVDKNEFKSGKYQLAGDWLVNLPKTREWFNSRLETTFFPLLTHLFPEIISSPAVIRAHSVSLLKYNSSHPRTDVHIDNGILAMTLAMTPMKQYRGGGTYFEHMGVDNILHMDVGHGTFRPGSVRHGGHRVHDGTRYILGAFLLLEDRVEHVRRLKNRGSELRRYQDIEGAAKHFEWALAMNPKCTTCLKDWAEILHTQKDFRRAEEKIRYALELLENKDSDALFTLGVLLSEQGRDEESIEAYKQSIALNAEDAELCYNLGVKLGAKGMVKDEMKMYARATKANPKFGGAWLNWGTALAEGGDLDDAELMFLKALECEPEVVAKAMMNLGLLHNTRGNVQAQTGDFDGAKKSALEAGKFLDNGKPMLEALVASGTADDQVRKYVQQYRPLRLNSHRLLGQLYYGSGDFSACEAEFRLATERFPDEPFAWQMLYRVLDLQGKEDEAKRIMEKIASLSK